MSDVLELFFYPVDWVALRVFSGGRFPPAAPTRRQEFWTEGAGVGVILGVFLGFMLWNN